MISVFGFKTALPDLRIEILASHRRCPFSISASDIFKTRISHHVREEFDEKDAEAEDIEDPTERQVFLNETEEDDEPIIKELMGEKGCIPLYDIQVKVVEVLRECLDVNDKSKLKKMRDEIVPLLINCETKEVESVVRSYCKNKGTRNEIMKHLEDINVKPITKIF